MLKIYRKLSFLVVLCMVAATFVTGYAKVEPSKNTTLARNDFEGTTAPQDGSQDIYVVNGQAVTDEDAEHNRVSQNVTFSGNDSMGESGRIVIKNSVFASEPDVYFVEFDIKLLKDHPVRYYIQGTKGYIGYILFAKNGKITFMKSAGLPSVELTPTEETSTYGIADYTVGEWSTVGVKVDTKQNKISYYADGKYVCDATFSATIKQYISLFLGQANKVDKSEPYIRVDNVKVYEVTDETFYGKAQTDGKKVTVEFSEYPGKIDKTNVSVRNTETDSAVAVSSVSVKGKKAEITLGEKLDSDTEYCVVLPEGMVSFSGSDLYSNYIYFMSPVSGGEMTELFNDDFSDYTSSSQQVNLPKNYMAMQNGTYNHVDYYTESDEESATGTNTAVKVWNTGWARSIFTRNFGTSVSGDIEINFDVKMPTFNAYMEDDDPNFLTAITNSIDSMVKGSTYKTVNGNWGLYLAPVEEDGKNRTKSDGTSLKTVQGADWSYVSNNALVNPPEFFVLYGNRLGFGTLSGVDDGNYVEVETNEWYNVKLSLDLNQLTATGWIDGKKIGPFDLPVGMNDAYYGATAARMTFMVPATAHYSLKGGKVTYNDSTTGEEKTFTRVNDSQFILDNVAVKYRAPEFKAEATRLYDVDGEEFASLQTTTSTVNKIKISFSDGIDASAITADTLQITDEDGKTYGFTVEDYDDTKQAVTIALSEFLKKGDTCRIEISNIQNGDKDIKNYITTFKVTEDGVFRCEMDNVTDGSGNKISASAANGTTISADGYILNTEDTGKKINVFVAGYKATEYGEKISGIRSETVDATAGSYIVYGSGKTDSISTTLGDSADYVKVYADVEGEYKTGTSTTAASASGDYTITVSGKAEADSVLKIDIPKSSSEYAEDKSCTMLYRNTVKTDAEGNYSVDISVADAETGEYTAYVYNAEKLTKATGDFVYANPDDTKTAIEELTLHTTMTTEDVLKNYHIALGISSELYAKGSAKKAAAIIDAYLEKNTVSASDVAGAKKIAVYAYTISALSEGKISDLFDYADELQLGNGSIKEYCDADFVKTTVRQNVTKAVSGKTYTTFKNFEDSLLREFILKVVANPDGYGNAKKVIITYSDEIGITKSYSDKAYRLTADKEYTSYDELIAALNKNNKSNESGGSSSGGGYASGGDKPGVNDIAWAGDNPASSSAQNEMEKNIFIDIEDVSWAKHAIVYLAEKGIVNGTSADTFSPNDSIKREELAKIIVSAFDIKSDANDVSFIDVAPDEWYYPFIVRAYGAGVVKGYSESVFGVGDNITRQDLAVMIYNAAEASGFVFSGVSEDKFDDDDSIADYAKNAVYTLKNEGVVNGVDSDNFAPSEPATRAEAAKIIYSLLKI